MTTKDPRLAKRITEEAEKYSEADLARNPNGYTVAEYCNSETTSDAHEAGSNLLAPLLEQMKEAVERIDKWTIDPKDKAIDENFAGEGCRQFIKDRCSEALAAYERFLEGVKK